MIRNLALWAIRSYIGGPGRSWLFTSAAMLGWRLVKRATGRRELIDLSSIRRGETIVIELLPVSHEQQIKEMRQSRREARRARIGARREARRARRAEPRAAAG